MRTAPKPTRRRPYCQRLASMRNSWTSSKLSSPRAVKTRLTIVLGHQIRQRSVAMMPWKGKVRLAYKRQVTCHSQQVMSRQHKSYMKRRHEATPAKSSSHSFGDQRATLLEKPRRWREPQTTNQLLR
ncbi:hypothetical protein MRX96_000481 [Rhipicephalus microplus]